VSPPASENEIAGEDTRATNSAQAAGKVEIDVRKIPADYLSLAGHKLHAPKGIGARNLSRENRDICRNSPFSPWACGGHQERNRRGGTESVPLIDPRNQNFG